MAPFSSNGAQCSFRKDFRRTPANLLDTNGKLVSTQTRPSSRMSSIVATSF